jgi:hypothetical protein
VGTASIEDAFSPSTQQQVGLYSTVLVEPQGSIWKDNETGVLLGTRNDGGPASWQAIIEVPPTLWTDLDGDGDLDDPSHREFYFAFADFQPAYEAGAGARITQSNENLLGDEVNIDSYADFAGAINPPFRLPPNSPDIYLHPNACPGPEAGELGLPRPCPEAISADDPGTYVLNFRNEPIGLRIFEDANLDAKLDEGEDLNGNGVLDQVIGDRGDLALAFQSRNDRVIPQLNDPAGPYPSLTFDVGPGDPWTPMMRVYLGDQVRIRTHVGAHEEEHNFTVHGLKWRSEPNSPNAGYRNSASMESYKLDIPFVADVGKSGNPNRVDYLYTIGADTEGWWNGVWGLLRSYGKLRADLQPLPNSRMTDTGLPIPNEADFDETCPVTAPVANNGQPFRVYAVRADQILGPQGLVYNDRTTSIAGPLGGVQGVGPLIDPMGIMYVLEEDLDITPGTRATPPVINGLKVGVPTDPLILRARAGDCIKVQLVNALPSTMIDANGDPTSNQNQSIGFQAQADMDGWNAVPPIIHKDESPSVLGDIVTFNFNDMQPSSYVGLHPQLVAYNIRTSDGSNVGDNDFNPNKQGKANGSLVPPGTTQKGNNQKFNDETYTWYAGDLRIDPQTGNLVSTPVEFGATALLSADKIKGSNKGSVGALIIEPEDATWTLGVGGDGRLTRAQATVTTNGATFREFVTVLQNGLNLRYGGGMCAPDPSSFDCAVPNIAAEGPLGPMEASQDSGQKAVNYRTEPLWFRLGIAPSTPFGAIIRSATLKDLIPEVFSNSLDIGDGLGPVGEPQTPVYTASPSDEVRLRVVMPGGHARGVTYTVHGHGWQRQPYIGDSTQIGDNPDSQYYGSQEGVNPSGHWDFVPEHAGGPSGVPGDYLWRDQGSFGSYQGLWGLLRVTP